MPEDETPDTGREADGEPDLQAEVEKWKALARKHEGQAKSNATAARKLKEQEDAQKSEAQRAADKAAELERRASSAEQTALKLEVALDKAPDGMSIAQVRKLAKRLTGETREDLEADAAELFADFAPGDGAGDKDPSQRRPRERLRSGSTSSTEPEEDDPEKLAAKVPRPY